MKRKKRKGHIDRSETFDQFLAKDGILAETEDAAIKEIIADESRRRLTDSESKKANALLDNIRARLQVLAAGDPELLFAYRRRIHIRLMQDERGRPALRRKLKAQKWLDQNGKCALCLEALPKAESELDRLKASAGYTAANTRLVPHACHRKQQAKRGFK
jgi:hypothetical protein